MMSKNNIRKIWDDVGDVDAYSRLIKRRPSHLVKTSDWIIFHPTGLRVCIITGWGVPAIGCAVLSLWNIMNENIPFTVVFLAASVFFGYKLAMSDKNRDPNVGLYDLMGE